MNLLHLQIFKDVAQTRSVTLGAAANNVSQSAVSQQLREIEESLGVRLLDRKRRPLVLTEAGRLYNDFCRDVLRRKQTFEIELEKLKDRAEGTVRVAAIYSVGLSEMSRLEKEFATRHPKAELRVEYLRPEKVYLAVTSETADLGLVSYPEAKKSTRVIPWREERMVVAMAPTHSLARHEAIAPAQLEGHQFVGFDEDLPISRAVARFLRENSVEVDLVMRFDNIGMMKEAVMLGSGLSILPEPMLHLEVTQGRLRAVPLKPPGLVRPLGIIHLRGKKFNRSAKAFLELLKEPPTSEPSDSNGA